MSSGKTHLLERIDRHHGVLRAEEDGAWNGLDWLDIRIHQQC